MQRQVDRVIPDRETKNKNNASAAPIRRGRVRYSLQLDPGTETRTSRSKSPKLRKSQGSIKGHRRRVSKEILLSPFRSVARRLSRTSLNNSHFLNKDVSNSEDSHAPTPFHNASTSPEPKLHEPEPANLRNEEDMFIRHLADNDYLSDTLSEKYPLPEDNIYEQRRRQLLHQISSSNSINNNGQIQNHDSLQQNEQRSQQTFSTNSSSSKVSVNFPILVVQSISKYTFLEDLSGAELALRSLRTLSLDRNTHAILSNVGSIKACLSCMERFFAKSISILKLGLLFLGDISRESEVNKKHIGQYGGLQLINKILLDQRFHNQDIELLERACITLRTICANCDYNAILGGVCGTIEAILTLMRRFSRSIEIQERCLDILTTIIRDASENIDIALDLGIISEVLLSIRQYPDFIDLQISASRTICELARANDIAREDLVNTGLLSDLYNSLLNFSSNPKFLEYLLCVSRCIRYLAFSSINRSKIVNHTNLTVLFTQYISKFKNEKRLCISVLQALANITYDEEIGKYNVVQGNGIFTLLNILDIYLNDVILCEAICRVLRNASDGDLPTKKLFGKHNSILRISKVIQIHIKIAGIQDHSFATLINLWPSHELQIRSLAIEGLLLQSSVLHSNNYDVMRQINALTSRLDSPSNTHGRTGALLCLKGHTSDKRVNKTNDYIIGERLSELNQQSNRKRHVHVHGDKREKK